MKKIMFMVTSMNIGGVEKSLLSLLAEIPRDKYEITLLMLEKKGGLLEYIPAWINVEEVTWYKNIKPIIMQSPQQTIKDLFKGRKYWSIITFIITYLLSKHFNNRFLYYKYVFNSIPESQNIYDIAIAYQGPTDVIDYYIANKVYAKKKFSWVHFDVSRHQVNQKLYKKLYKRMDKIFVVSKQAKMNLLDEIPIEENKVEVFSNIIPKKFIDKMALEPISFDAEYKGIKILTVGRLSEEKGQDIAIKVLDRLRRNNFEVRWYCIGDGGYKSFLQELIKKYNLQDYFILMGSKTNPYPYIKAADLYVQTSRHEGYCLTLAESKCLERPIITTNFTGAYEQINNNENGIIVECDESKLYEKVRYLIENKEMCNVFSANLAKEKGNSNMGIQKISEYFG